MEALKGILESIVRDVLNAPHLEIPWTQKLNEIEGWDSLNNIAIIAEFEKQLGTRFSSKDLLAFNTPQDILQAAKNLN